MIRSAWARFVGVLDLAIDAYLSRAPLYLTLALLLCAVDAVLTYVFALNVVGQWVTALALLSPLHGVVALGTAAFVRERHTGSSELLSTGLRRWLDIFVIDVIATVCGALAFGTLIKIGEDALSFLTLIPMFAIWGCSSLADVIVVVEPIPAAPTVGEAVIRRITHASNSLFAAFRLGLQIENLGRMIALAAAQLPPALLSIVLHDQAAQHHLPAAAAGADIPLAFLFDGAYEALFTVVYLRLHRPASLP